MDYQLEVKRLDDIVASRLRFLDTIRDESVRGMYWETMVKPYWLLADAFRQRLES
jgi:hypothetical protein